MFSLASYKPGSDILFWLRPKQNSVPAKQANLLPSGGPATLLDETYQELSPLHRIKTKSCPYREEFWIDKDC